MAAGKIRKAVDKSIKAGISNGALDEELNAAPLAMLQFMADLMDSDMGESSIMRYVSPASFLTYCERLGFVPDVKPGRAENKTQTEVVKLVGGSKWKRA